MPIELPLVLDTDLLSDFAWINRLDILVQLYDKEMRVMDEVMNELAKVPHLKQRVQKLIDDGFIHLVSLKATDPEAQELARLIDAGQLDSGEATCLAYLKFNYGALASNNLSDIHKACLEKNIDLVTTPDVFRAAWETGVLSEKEANKIWADMLRKRKLPAASLTEYISKNNN